MTKATLFAGPSAYGVPAALLDGGRVDLRPPARRGDIESLVAEAGGPRVLVLCDGVFQSAPAVSHAELCLALDAGWQVWGVSSLGAIRAFEMRNEGMRGFGYVYAQFARYADFKDDELCLLHMPQPDYMPLTEALVNVRYALDRWSADLRIGARARRAILAELRALWFGERTAERLREAMVVVAGMAPAAADALLARLEHGRVKTLDLTRLLTLRPWETIRPTQPNKRGE